MEIPGICRTLDDFSVLGMEIFAALRVGSVPARDAVGAAAVCTRGCGDTAKSMEVPLIVIPPYPIQEANMRAKYHRCPRCPYLETTRQRGKLCFHGRYWGVFGPVEQA